MSTGIYLVEGDGQLLEMSETAYPSEGDLQELIAKYPGVLPGAQIDPSAPRRWLLVDREVGLPSEDDGGRRWSVDHLFLDQEAIPTLVEVKRSDDTRIRREVVGQLLEYAANATAYWPSGAIRETFEANCTHHGLEPETELLGFLQGEADPDGFWRQADENLRAGKVRLLFVADSISAELQRIIDFLAEHMDPPEVPRRAIGPNT